MAIMIAMKFLSARPDTARPRAIRDSALGMISNPGRWDGRTRLATTLWDRFQVVFPRQTRPNLIDFLTVFSLKLQVKFKSCRGDYGDFRQDYSFSQNFFSVMHPAMAATPNSSQSNVLNQ